MLLTRQKRAAPFPQLNMTPMIDVIFQLLVFFMCTASFSVENMLQTQLPESGPSKPGDEEDFPPVRVRLSRMTKGVLVTCDEQPCTTFDDLVRKLSARRQIADMRVIIEGEPAVPFGHMAGALDACHQADLKKVVFSPKGVAK